MVLTDAQKRSYAKYYEKVKESRKEYYKNYHQENKEKLNAIMRENNSIKYYTQKNPFAFFPSFEIFI